LAVSRFKTQKTGTLLAYLAFSICRSFPREAVGLYGVIGDWLKVNGAIYQEDLTKGDRFTWSGRQEVLQQ
jgi:hypothetical protein